MQLSELIAGTLDLSKRPDQESIARLRINAAVKSICFSGIYDDDLFEATLPLTIGDSVHSVAKPVRYRKIEYIVYPDTYKTIELIRPSQIRREARILVDKWYPSGTRIIIRVENAATTQLLWGYYTYPEDLLNDGDTNWITEYFPELIIDMASSAVLHSVGETKRANAILNYQTFELGLFVTEKLNVVSMGVSTGR